MFRNLLFRVTVSGESCWPELVPSKTYFASCLRRPRVGDYVVFQNPHLQKSAPARDMPPHFPLVDDRLLMGNNKTDFYIKKVLREKNGMLHLGGTVSWSSTRTIPQSSVIGTLLYLKK